MIRLTDMEFYQTPTGGIMIHDASGSRKLTEHDRDFIAAMMDKISDFYPDSLKGASEEYIKYSYNIPLYEYKIISRVIKCNWGKFDSTMDIDRFGNFNFEEVECPLRGECRWEGVICKPKFNSNLSDREQEVMQLFYEGASDEDVANRLCISIETVKTHKRNAFRRTGVHSLPEFIIYARDKKLFK